MNLHLGPFVQLLLEVPPRPPGLEPQRVPHQVDAVVPAVDQRQISYGNSGQSDLLMSFTRSEH